MKDTVTTDAARALDGIPLLRDLDDRARAAAIGPPLHR